MKYILSFLAAFGLLVGSASAELDLKAQRIIENIRKGVDGPDQIETLRVKTAVVLPDNSLEVADLPSQATVTGRVVTAISYNGSNSIVFTTRPVVFVNGVATMGSANVTTNSVP